jgi:hypothetical protein
MISTFFNMLISQCMRVKILPYSKVESKFKLLEPHITLDKLYKLCVYMRERQSGSWDKRHQSLYPMLRHTLYTHKK